MGILLLVEATHKTKAELGEGHKGMGGMETSCIKLPEQHPL